MSNEWNRIQQSLLHIPFSLFQFWGFLIGVKIEENIFRDMQQKIDSK